MRQASQQTIVVRTLKLLVLVLWSICSFNAKANQEPLFQLCQIELLTKQKVDHLYADYSGSEQLGLASRELDAYLKNLFRQTMAGNKVAEREFYKILTGAVFNYLYFLMIRKDFFRFDPLDLTQDTLANFVEAVNKGAVVLNDKFKLINYVLKAAERLFGDEVDKFMRRHVNEDAANILSTHAARHKRGQLKLREEQRAPRLKESPGDLLDALALAAVIERAMEQLDEKHHYIIEQRIFAGLSLEEVGKELKVTRERIRQLEADAFASLQSKIKVALEDTNFTSSYSERIFWLTANALYSGPDLHAEP